jgi:hypothetical protein
MSEAPRPQSQPPPLIVAENRAIFNQYFSG